MSRSCYLAYRAGLLQGFSLQQVYVYAIPGVFSISELLLLLLQDEAASLISSEPDTTLQCPAEELFRAAVKLPRYGDKLACFFFMLQFESQVILRLTVQWRS